jgi:arylsulfatase A-like enzyme
MMMLYGSGIRPGEPIGECTNLDIAPTLLTLVGLPVPEEMKGRVLREAFDEAQANWNLKTTVVGTSHLPASPLF